MDIRATMLEILHDLHPDIDFVSHQSLVDDKVLDSFDIVTLVTEIDDAFDVTVTADELVPENFNTLDAMCALIEKKLDD